MTNKEFLSTVTEQLLANPRKVLAGHGISGTMLNKIKTRDDIFEKLASILNKLKTFKRGAIGLKKSSVFQIKVYKNFNEFNAKARLDVDNFISGLKPDDAEKFNNADNIVCVVFDPKDCGLESEEARMAAGFSKLCKFDILVKKEYKIPGVSYIMVMYADSAIRTVEAKVAERKASRNEKENKREEKPAKIKKALADKKKLAAKIRSIKSEANQKLSKNKQELQKLRAQEQKLRFQNQQLAQVGTQNALDKKFRKERVNALKVKLANAVKVADKYIEMLETAVGKKRLSIQSMLSKKNKEIRKLRAQIGTYDRLGPAAIAKKGELLKLVQQKIQANLAKGESISASMNDALDSINARPAQRQLIKQQVINQVADGMPMDKAVQQAVQQNVRADGGYTDNELEKIADDVIKENRGKAPKQYLLPKQIYRLGNVNMTSQDVTRVGEIINNKLLNASELNSVRKAGQEIDDTADIITSNDAKQILQEIDKISTRKRRTKKEMIKYRRELERAKKAKLRAKKEKMKALKLAKAQKLAAKKAKKLGLTPVQQRKQQATDFQDLVDAIDNNYLNVVKRANQQIAKNQRKQSTNFQNLISSIYGGNTKKQQKIDPVVQQILDDTSVESNDFQDLVDAIDEISPVRKRRSKKEMIEYRRELEKAKKAKLRAKKEKMKALKLAKAQKLAAKKAKKLGLSAIQQRKQQSINFQDLINAIDDISVKQQKIDPVVQQILDNTSNNLNMDETSENAIANELKRMGYSAGDWVMSDDVVSCPSYSADIDEDDVIEIGGFEGILSPEDLIGDGPGDYKPINDEDNDIDIDDMDVSLNGSTDFAELLNML